MALTDEECLAAWHALGLGRPPADLELSVPDTVVEAAVEYAIALDQLQHRGLVLDAGLGPDLTAALRALGRGSIQLELRLSDGLIVLGAVDGDRGGLLVIDDAHDPGLYLLPMPGPAVAPTMVELAGPLNPGWVMPITIPAEVLDEARAHVEDGSWWTLAGLLVERGVDQLAAQSLALMCTDISSGGQVEVRSVVPDGADDATDETVHPWQWALGFHRGSAGDYLQVRRPREAGRTDVTIAPITAEDLLVRLHELIASLPTS